MDLLKSVKPNETGLIVAFIELFSSVKGWENRDGTLSIRENEKSSA